MTLVPEESARYAATFLPYAAEAAERVRRTQLRFAYYTTAATAIKILQNHEIWMRNARVMNDFLEVEHGLACLSRAYNSTPGTALKATINAVHSGLAEEVEAIFNSWIPQIRNSTYLTCLSEHTDEEDNLGRLSMWRAYGGSSGVALIFKGNQLFRSNFPLPVVVSPVGYLGDSGFHEELIRVAGRVHDNLDLLAKLGREGTKSALLNTFRFAAVCTKHPAFKEEREWRLLETATLGELPASLGAATETLGGIPQTVLKLKLVDQPALGLTGFNLNALLDRVLIGPTEHADVVATALVASMNAAAIERAGDRVVFTGIPLRPNRQ